jgi:diguanylate cyclase (GGDEF)-like protein/PAS domain S-box-containing protein
MQINHALRDLLPQGEFKTSARLPLHALEPLGLRHFGTPLTPQDWPLVKAAREGVSVLNFACEIPLEGGRLMHLLGNAIPLWHEGQSAGAIAAFLDITPLRLAEQEVAEQEERYRRLFELMPEGLCVHDGDQAVMANSAMARLTGYERSEELVGQHILSFIHIDDRPAINAMQQQIDSGVTLTHPLPMRLIRRDGSLVHVEVSTSTLRLGGKKLVQTVVRDVTRQREAEEQTRLAARVFEASQDGIFITDNHGLIISVNPAFTQRTGYTIADLLGKDPGMISSGQHDDSFYRSMWQALAGEGHWESEIHNRHKNGELLAQWISISALRDEEGILRHYIAVLSDITEHKSSTSHMAYLAQHDFLTGLPNRILLRDRLNQGISAANRDRKEMAVLFIDLDGFKQVNDHFGHAVGDQLLKEVARRMQVQLRDIDTVSRLGGDEFVVLLRDLGGISGAAMVATKLCQTIAEPYRIGTLTISALSASIGVSRYPGDGDDIDALLDHADQAMYRAKHSGKNTVVFYDEALTGDEANPPTSSLAPH